METDPQNATETAPKRARNTAPASFKLPWIVCDVFNALQTAEEKAELAQAVFAYVKEGKATPPKSLAAATFFEMARKQIEILQEHGARVSAVRKEIGARGGARFAEICARTKELEAKEAERKARHAEEQRRSYAKLKKAAKKPLKK